MSSEPTPRPVTLARALVLFVIYSVAFAVGGGIGAGIPALLYELVATGEPDPVLYAIMFGATGYIAYRLARRVAEGA